MIRQVFVADTALSADQIYHQVSLDEITLVIGMDRIPAPGNDLTALTEAAVIADKLERVVNAYHRDVRVRISQLQKAAEQRATAPALCMCGGPNTQGITHRTHAPCYRDEIHLFSTTALAQQAGIDEPDPRPSQIVERVFTAPTDEATP